MLKSLVPLTWLYCMEAFGIAMATFSTPNALLENKTPFSNWMFSYALLLPLVLRLVIAPVMDILYWEHGKRRSQITVILAVIAVFLYFTQWDLTNAQEIWIRQLELLSLLAILDLALSGWVCEQFDFEHRQYGSISQLFGFVAGAIIGTFVFGLLSNEEFCTKFLFTPKGVAMFPYDKAYRFMSYFAAGMSVLCALTFTGERQSNPNYILEIYQNIVQFYQNRQLLMLSLFLLLFRTGLLPIDLIHHHLMQFSNSISTEVVDPVKYSLEQIYFIGCVALAVATVLPLYTAKITSARLEIRYILIFSIYKIIISCVLCLFLYVFEHNIVFSYRLMILNISIISCWIINILNISLAYTFIHKITQSSVSATFVALLTAPLNLNFILEGLVVLIMPYINYLILWAFGLAWHIYILKALGGKLTEIDQMEPIEFCLDIDTKKEQLIPSQEMTQFV